MVFYHDNSVFVKHTHDSPAKKHGADYSYCLAERIPKAFDFRKAKEYNRS